MTPSFDILVQDFFCRRLIEQQGVSLEDFDRRRHQPFWQGLVATIPEWDRLIDEFNDEVGHAPGRRAS